MKLTRRNTLKTSVLIGGVAALPFALSREAGAISLVVHDSRLPASRSFVAPEA